MGGSPAGGMGMSGGMGGKGAGGGGAPMGGGMGGGGMPMGGMGGGGMGPGGGGGGMPIKTAMGPGAPGSGPMPGMQPGAMGRPGGAAPGGGPGGPQGGPQGPGGGQGGPQGPGGGGMTRPPAMSGAGAPQGPGAMMRGQMGRTPPSMAPPPGGGGSGSPMQRMGQGQPPGQGGPMQRLASMIGQGGAGGGGQSLNLIPGAEAPLGGKPGQNMSPRPLGGPQGGPQMTPRPQPGQAPQRPPSTDFSPRPPGQGQPPGVEQYFRRPEMAKGLDPQLAARADAMMRGMPADARSQSGFISGTRDRATQADLYKKYQAGGHIAAPPGHSQHEIGKAIDVKDPTGWIHKHAGEYGLNFPLGKKDYPHMQMSDAKGYKPPQPQPGRTPPVGGDVGRGMDKLGVGQKIGGPVGRGLDQLNKAGVPTGIPRDQGGGKTVQGSWYSQHQGKHSWVDKADKPGSNALGVPDSKQGIALPGRETLGKWFDVTAPNGQTHRLQQTDIGPSKRTGRGIDISAAAAEKMGYAPHNFPTNGKFTFKPASGPGGGQQVGGGQGGQQGGRQGGGQDQEGIKQFQKQMGLTPDGIVGPQTKAALAKIAGGGGGQAGAGAPPAAAGAGQPGGLPPPGQKGSWGPASSAPAPNWKTDAGGRPDYAAMRAARGAPQSSAATGAPPSPIPPGDPRQGGGGFSPQDGPAPGYKWSDVIGGARGKPGLGYDAPGARSGGGEIPPGWNPGQQMSGRAGPPPGPGAGLPPMGGSPPASGGMAQQMGINDIGRGMPPPAPQTGGQGMAQGLGIDAIGRGAPSFVQPSLRPGPPQMGATDAHIGAGMSPSRMQDQMRARQGGIPPGTPMPQPRPPGAPGAQPGQFGQKDTMGGAQMPASDMAQRAMQNNPNTTPEQLLHTLHANRDRMHPEDRAKLDHVMRAYKREKQGLPVEGNRKGGQKGGQQKKAKKDSGRDQGGDKKEDRDEKQKKDRREDKIQVRHQFPSLRAQKYAPLRPQYQQQQPLYGTPQ